MPVIGFTMFPVGKLGTISYNENDGSSAAFWGLEYFPEDSFQLFGVVHARSLTRLNPLHILQPRVLQCIGMSRSTPRAKERARCLMQVSFRGFGVHCDIIPP